jgi:energy-coupling factor transporter ATP-binding protein EcfA2
MPELSFDSVTIDGFRGLRNFRLDDVGQINLLVGPNNSGKTSVLEALSILCNAFEPFEWVSMVRRRDFGRLDETRIQSLRWCFPQSGQPIDPDQPFEGECTMSCEGLPLVHALRVNYQEIVGDPDPQETERRKRGLIAEGNEEQNGDTEGIKLRRGARITHSITQKFHNTPSDLIPIAAEVWEDNPVYVGLKRPYVTPLQSDTLTPYSYQINRVQVSSQSRHVFGEDGAMVLELVRQFDPDVRGVVIASFRGNRPAIYLDHKRLGPAPLSVFGDGLRRAVLLASTLLTLRGGGILLIDEIETGIHVSALQRVFAWLTESARNLRVRIFATTHSLEAVDAIVSAGSDGPSDIVSYHLEQTASETRVKRIEGDLLLRLRRERALDVR